MTQSEIAGHTLALLTIIVWGITFVSTRILLGAFTPFEILYMRFFLGWLALWAICPKWLKFQDLRREAIFLGAGLSGITIYFLLENMALVFTHTSNVAIIVTSAPFFTAMLSWLFFRGARPDANFFLGICLAICGVGLICLNGARLRLNPLGDLLALGAAIAWAFYTILTRKLATPGSNPLLITRHIFFYGLLLMLPFLAMSEHGPSMDALENASNLLNLLFLGLIASAACFASWTFCIRAIGAVSASLYIYLVPAVTAICAALVLAEKPTPLSCAGIVLTIAGLLIAELRPFRKKTPFL